MAKKSETEVKTISVVEVKDEVAVINANIALIESGNGGNVKVRRPQPGSSAAKQLAHFASQDRVRYRLPKAADEVPGSFESPQVNDLMITVVKGVSVNLPEDIAKILDDSQNISDNARQQSDFRIDENTPSELKK